MSDPDATAEANRPGSIGDESATNRPRRAVGRVDDWFADLRRDPTRRRIALTAGVIVGLALAWVHWLGLIVGGALVGLSRRSLLRAIVAAIGFGVATLLLTVLAPGTVGVAAVDAFAPASYAAIAIGVLLPVWGALLRGVV